MLLYIVRHGETEENALGVLQGRTPGKLNSTCVEQARMTGTGRSLMPAPGVPALRPPTYTAPRRA